MPASPARQILRASLKSTGANGAGAFVPQCTKLVFEYCEKWPSSSNTRSFLGNNIRRLAESNPHVEFLLKERASKEPIIRGHYINGRSKEICLKGFEVTTIAQKVQLLLDSSGAKIKPLKNRTVESTTESTRGIWSGLHTETPFRI